jgi:hypothetical protein
MRKSCVPAALVLALLSLSGCNHPPRFVAKDEPWRAEEERACLMSGAVRENAFVLARAALGGPAVCGALQPLTMFAAAGGRVALKPPALLRCPMVPALEQWVRHVVIPAAHSYFGMPVVELKVAASYSCRPMNHVDGARLSEHGHANAVDVSGFVLANGHTVTVSIGWWGGLAERAFLRAVHQGACAIFTTVLGPNADRLHRDHFHLDLARRYGGATVCK